MIHDSVTFVVCIFNTDSKLASYTGLYEPA